MLPMSSAAADSVGHLGLRVDQPLYPGKLLAMTAVAWVLVRSSLACILQDTQTAELKRFPCISYPHCSLLVRFFASQVFGIALLQGGHGAPSILDLECGSRASRLAPPALQCCSPLHSCDESRAVSRRLSCSAGGYWALACTTWVSLTLFTAVVRAKRKQRKNRSLPVPDRRKETSCSPFVNGARTHGRRCAGRS